MSNPERSRFGLIWRIYDIVAIKGLDFQVPILPGSVSSSGWLIGGMDPYNNFLVTAAGCSQPAKVEAWFVQESYTPSVNLALCGPSNIR